MRAHSSARDRPAEEASGANRVVLTVATMAVEPLTCHSDLRRLFDHVVDLPPDRREAAIAALDVADETRAQLRMMARFDELIDEPSESREAKLSSWGIAPSECAQLALMLSSHAKVPALLQATAVEASHRLDEYCDDDDLGQSLVGTTIGTFRLLALIGQGGSSMVFRAEREAGDGSQVVALKLLRTGLYSADAQRRFRREQAILAQLTHPNIASLIEGGVSAAGVPFIAMELVEGEPITRAADSRGLDIRQRLKLFCLLCRTIEAAHASLIVHRDLKPSNLFVTSDGDLKVLDFGIAKLVDEESGAHTHSVALTPGYAAPEQYRSETLTTAIDVFALGVVLTELLTGRKGASDMKPSALVGLATDAAPLPSGMAQRAMLVRQLRGDLDDIVLRAVAGEPELRYRTAGAVADDVERYLAGEPVRAHPPSRWYRARKFVTRHRVGLALATFLTVTIMTILAVVVWQSRNLEREVRRADTIRNFLEDMFAPIENGLINDKQANVRDLLSAATRKLGIDATLDDAARIDLQLMFSRLHERMNNADQAQALADEASALATSRLRAGDPLRLDAEISRAYTLLELGKRAEAEPLFDALQARGKKLAVHGPALVRFYDGLAELADDRSNHEAAIEYERVALDERIAAYGGESPKAAIGYSNLGTSLQFTRGHLEGAIDAYEHAYRIYLANFGQDSYFTAFTRRNLSVVQLLAGHLRAAHEGLLSIEPMVDAPLNNQREFKVFYWEGRCQLATEIGAPENDGTCDRVMRAATELLGPDNVALNASTLRMRALWDIDHGEFGAAQQRMQQSRAFAEASGSRASIGGHDYVSGLLDLASGNAAGAAQKFNDAVRNLDQYYPEHMRLNALALRALVCSQNANFSSDSCPADAESLARSELDKQVMAWHPRLIPAHIALSRIDLQRGHAASAAVRLRNAIEHASNEVDPSQIHLVEAKLWLILAEIASGHCERAQAEATAITALPGQDALRTHPLLAAARSQLQNRSTCDLWPSAPNLAGR